VPLTYLPLTWTAFGPAVLSGIDPRWTSTVSELALFALLVRVAGGARKPTSAPLLVLFAAWFPASSLVTSDALTAMPVQLLALGAAAALVATRASVAPVAVGLSMATTPLAGALLPLVSLYWWTDGPRALLRRVAVALGTAAALILPWMVCGPRAFLAGTVQWFGELDGFPRRTWETTHAWAHIAGFTGVFWTLGWERLLRPAQALVVLGVALGWRAYGRNAQSGSGSAWLGAAVATLLGFTLLNVIVWPYLYEPAAVLALAAVAVGCREELVRCVPVER